MNYTQNYIHAACSQILTVAPNGEGREDQITYKLRKKKSYSQRCQLDLNLRPESWRLPHQIQSCLARLVIIMTSLGPDWHHDKLVSVLWRTWFDASTQPILLRMGPQSLKVQPTLLVCNVTVCALLLFTWSWVLRLPWWTPTLLLGCCNRRQNSTTLHYKHLESRSYHTHITTHFITNTQN